MSCITKVTANNNTSCFSDLVRMRKWNAVNLDGTRFQLRHLTYKLVTTCQKSKVTCAPDSVRTKHFSTKTRSFFGEKLPHVVSKNRILQPNLNRTRTSVGPHAGFWSRQVTVPDTAGPQHVLHEQYLKTNVYTYQAMFSQYSLMVVAQNRKYPATYKIYTYTCTKQTSIIHFHFNNIYTVLLIFISSTT